MSINTPHEIPLTEEEINDFSKLVDEVLTIFNKLEESN